MSYSKTYKYTLTFHNEAGDGFVYQVTPHLRRDPKYKLSDQPQWTGPKHALAWFADRYSRERNEVTYAAFLGVDDHLLAVTRLTEGDLTSTTAEIREIMGRGYMLNAHAVVLAHNHPGAAGKPSPSEQDIKSFKHLRETLERVDMHLLDSYVFNDDGTEYVSIGSVVSKETSNKMLNELISATQQILDTMDDLPFPKKVKVMELNAIARDMGGLLDNEGMSKEERAKKLVRLMEKMAALGHISGVGRKGMFSIGMGIEGGDVVKAARELAGLDPETGEDKGTSDFEGTIDIPLGDKLNG